MDYVLTILNRKQLLDGNRGEEFDNLVAAARKTMKPAMNEGPACGFAMQDFARIGKPGAGGCTGIDAQLLCI